MLLPAWMESGERSSANSVKIEKKANAEKRNDGTGRIPMTDSFSMPYVV